MRYACTLTFCKHLFAKKVLENRIVNALVFTHKNKIPCDSMPGLLYSCLKNTGKNKLSFFITRLAINVIKSCPRLCPVSLLLAVVMFCNKCHTKIIDNVYRKIQNYIHCLHVKCRQILSKFDRSPIFVSYTY